MNLVTDVNTVLVERRFFLFQVDFSKASFLNSALAPRSTSDSRSPGEDIRVSDVADYDNPRSFLYWRNVLERDYTDNLQSALKAFEQSVFTALNSNKLKLRFQDPIHPYTDLSPFIKTVNNYEVQATAFSNQIQFTRARPENTDMVSTPNLNPGSKHLSTQFNDTVFDGLGPRENDVVMVKTSYNGGPFFTEYLGFITSVNQSYTNGTLYSYTIDVEGMSKILMSTMAIFQRSQSTEQFIPGVEINDMADQTPFASQFNDKNVASLFDFMQKQVFMAGDKVKNTASTSKATSYLYQLDPTPFISAEKIGFQYNIIVLMTLFLMTTTEAPQQSDLDKRIFHAAKSQLSNTALQTFITRLASAKLDTPSEIPLPGNPILDQPFMGYLEHGDHYAFNLMLAQGWEMFYSQLQSPGEVLNAIRTTSYYDIFESRNGVIVCRPPKINKIEFTTEEWDNLNAESFNGHSPDTLFAYNPVTSTYEFNPRADFFIHSEEIISASKTRNDADLESRVDVKHLWKLQGEQEFPAGSFVDADSLFRYGLRSHGVISNPNAYNQVLAKLFAPIVLTFANAGTRRMEVVVKDTRRFFVGKLYYIESLDMVGYLSSDQIGDAYGQLGTRTLSFTLARSVARRNLRDMVNTPNECLNFSMMFLDDVPDTPEGGFKNLKNDLIEKGQTFLEAMLFDAKATNAKNSSQTNPALGNVKDASPKVVMFRYLPTILDLIANMEQDNSIPAPPQAPTVTAVQASKIVVSRISDCAAPNNQCRATMGSPTWPFEYENFYPIYEKLMPALALSGIPIQKEIGAPESVAGVFPYLGGDRVNGLFEQYNIKRYEISAFNTPFLNLALSDPPQNMRLSQLLVNKLTALDTVLKYRTDKTSIFDNYANGFPQLYCLIGNTFHLFSPDSSVYPKDYIKSRHTFIDGSVNGTAGMFEFNLLQNYPQVLKLDSSTFSGVQNFFQVSARDGAFNLPFGHIIVQDKAPNATSAGLDVGTTSYYKIHSTLGSNLGGKFIITAGQKLGEWYIQPADSTSLISLDVPNSKPHTNNDARLQLSSISGLYFTSPYMEMTVERLLDIYLPPKWGANLTTADANALKRESSALSNMDRNNRRLNGRAINLSPDYLLTMSRSDLYPINLVGRPTHTALASPSLPLVYRQFEILLKSVFPNAVPIMNALTQPRKLPDGTTIAMDSEVVYHIEVTDADESAYLSRFQNSLKA